MTRGSCPRHQESWLRQYLSRCLPFSSRGYTAISVTPDIHEQLATFKYFVCLFTFYF